MEKATGAACLCLRATRCGRYPYFSSTLPAVDKDAIIIYDLFHVAAGGRLFIDILRRPLSPLGDAYARSEVPSRRSGAEGDVIGDRGPAAACCLGWSANTSWPLLGKRPWAAASARCDPGLMDGGPSPAEPGVLDPEDAGRSRTRLPPESRWNRRPRCDRCSRPAVGEGD